MLAEDEIRIRELLCEMKRLRIELWLDGGKLKFRDHEGNLDAGLKAKLKAEKEHIITYLEMMEDVEKLPLTPLQYAYLLGEKDGYELGGCTAHYYLEYESDRIDADKLERVLNESIKANDALRMRIMESGWQYVQENVVHIGIKEYDGRSEWEHIRNERTKFGYKPEDWPMFNFAVTHLEEKDILHIDFDCMILDAASARMMIQNILRAYNGEEIKYPEFGFSDYLKLVSEQPQDEKAHQYWMKRCETLPSAPKLPYKKEFSEVKDIRFRRFEHFFTEEETSRLYDFSKKNHASLAAVVCTCFAKALYKKSGKQPLTLNLTLFSRQMIHKDANDILGEFTNIGLVSFEEEKADFAKQVMDVQMQFWKLLQYRNYDGTKILKAISKGKSTSAVMPVVFTCVLGEQGENEEIDGFREIYSLSRTPQVSLDHHVRENKGRLKISWDYIEELFAEDELKEWFDAYIGCIRKVSQLQA